MENKKNVKQNFLQKYFQKSTLKKKEKKKKKKKGIKREEPNLLLIIALLLVSPTTQPVPRREISDMILIIRRNISSNGYNQYY